MKSDTGTGRVKQHQPGIGQVEARFPTDDEDPISFSMTVVHRLLERMEQKGAGRSWSSWVGELRVQWMMSIFEISGVAWFKMNVTDSLFKGAVIKRAPCTRHQRDGELHAQWAAFECLDTWQ